MTVFAEGTEESSAGEISSEGISSEEDTGKGDTGKENAGKEYTDPQGHMVEETTVSTEQYKVDGADADQEQAEGLTLDHTMVETTAEADTYYMIVNSDGTYLEDEEGNAIKVSSDAELKEVKAYDATQAEAPDGDAVKEGEKPDETPSYVEVKEEDIKYGKFENGVFQEAEEGHEKDEGMTAYMVTDGVFKETIEAYSVVDRENQTVVIDEEVKDVLVTGEASENYQRETTYFVGEKEIDLSKYCTDQYSIDEDGTLTITAYQETGKGGACGGGKHGTGSYFYIVDAEGNRVKVPEQNVTAKTEYTVTTTEGGVEVITVDASALQNIQEQNFTKVEDMYVVKDDNGKDVYIEAGQWEMMTKHQVTLTEVTTYYYVTNPTFVNRYQDITVDGVEYRLEVSFLNGEMLYLAEDAGVSLLKKENGEIEVSLPYKYKAYDENGALVEKDATYTTTIPLSAFGLSHIATLKISYSPILKSTENVSFETETKEVEITTTETVEGQEGTKNVVNGTMEKPINCVDTNKWVSKTYSHVDVQIGTQVVIGGEKQSAGVSNVKLETEDWVFQYKNTTDKDPQGYLEYSTRNGTIGQNVKIGKNGYGTNYVSLSNDKPVVISCDISYVDKNGQTQTFTYSTALYLTSDPAYNTCTQRRMGGFDYKIPSTEIQAAIAAYEQTVTQKVWVDVEKESKSVVYDTKVGDANVDAGVRMIPAKVFVRLDNVEQLENGSTHYPTQEYSENLSLGNLEIYLIYNSNGYAVYGTEKEDGTVTVTTNLAYPKEGGYGSVEEAIAAFLAEGSDDNLVKIEEEYLGRDAVKTMLQNAVENQIRDSVDAQRTAIMEKLGATKAEEIDWEDVYAYSFDSETEKYVYSEALQSAIEEAMKEAYLNWYVLKVEDDGNHIDGNIVIPSVTFEVNGVLITTKPVVIGGGDSGGGGSGNGSSGGGSGSGSSGGGRSHRGTADVLGAKREDLQAVPEEGEVLGVARTPGTSDASKAILWMLVLGSSAVGVAAVMELRKKEAQ